MSCWLERIVSDKRCRQLGEILGGRNNSACLVFGKPEDTPHQTFQFPAISAIGALTFHMLGGCLREAGIDLCAVFGHGNAWEVNFGQPCDHFLVVAVAFYSLAVSTFVAPCLGQIHVAVPLRG